MKNVPMAAPEDISSLRQWFAVNTAPRHEKRISDRMVERELEVFLPLYRTERQWKKRVPVVLDLPLLPTYLFARIGPTERAAVLNIPGVLSIVGNGKRPIPVPQWEIEALRGGLYLRRAEPHPYLAVGDRVRIKAGPLAGLEGLLIRRKNLFRVVLSVELIMRSLSVEVEISEIEPVAGPPHPVDTGQRPAYVAT